jgi:hypothetical protein
VAGEHKGRTITEIDVPFHLLNLCGSGKSNEITLEFEDGIGAIFLWYFKVSAKLNDSPAASIAFPVM